MIPFCTLSIAFPSALLACVFYQHGEAKVAAYLALQFVGIVLLGIAWDISRGKSVRS